VLHRDLKPSNVLMVAAPGVPEGWLSRITDFGMGTLHEEGDGATLTGFWQGSPPYMAPEQVLPGLGRVDARSDLYALGAILYEMLTGRTPNPRGSAAPSASNPHVPPELDQLTLRAVAPNPDSRPQGMALLAGELRALNAGMDARGGASDEVEVAGSGSGSKAGPLAVAAAIVLMAVAWWIWRSGAAQ
jgi:serine/threonine-protein kinase